MEISVAVSGFVNVLQLVLATGYAIFAVQRYLEITQAKPSNQKATDKKQPGKGNLKRVKEQQSKAADQARGGVDKNVVDVDAKEDVEKGPRPVRKTLRKVCGLAIGVGSWFFFLGDVAAPAFDELVCGQRPHASEGELQTFYYNNCLDRSSSPVLMVWHQFGVFWLTIFAQVLISNRLIMFQREKANKSLLRIVRNFVSLAEFIAGILLASGMSALGVYICTGIDLVWTFFTLGNFCYIVKIEKRSRSTKTMAADTLVRCSLYALGQSIYYIGFLWTGVLPKGAAKVCLHFVALSVMVPVLGKSRIVYRLVGIRTNLSSPMDTKVNLMHSLNDKLNNTADSSSSSSSTSSALEVATTSSTSRI